MDGGSYCHHHLRSARGPRRIPILFLTVDLVLFMSSELLAIIEVDQAARVRCQAPGCNHPVYKSIHVVLDAGEIRVLGSSCFKTSYAGSALTRRKPRYTSGEGRRLTAEEVALLESNTAMLIAQLRQAWEHQQSTAAAPQSVPMPRKLSSIERQAEQEEARSVAIERVKRQHPGLVDRLHTPGFAGLIAMEYRAVLRERGLLD